MGTVHESDNILMCTVFLKHNLITQDVGITEMA